MPEIRRICSALLLCVCACGTTGCGEGVSREIANDVAVGGVLQAQRVDTFGCTSCTTPQLLDRVRHLSMTAAGTIFVTGASEPFIRRFRAAEGSPRDPNRGASFGRLGEGPGELGYPFYTFPVGEEGFFAVDTMPPRITEFSGGGDVIRTTIIPPFVPTNAGFDPATSTLVLAWMHPLASRGVRVSSWSVGDASVSGIPIPEHLFPAETPGRDRYRFALAVAPHGGVAIGQSWTYTILYFDRDGSYVREFGRDLERREKRPDEIGYELAEAERFAGTTGLPADIVERYAHHFGRFAFDFDDGGRLWVLSSHSPPGTTTFDLFTVEGEHIGELTLDVALEERNWRSGNTWDVAGDYLAGVYLDDDDNEFIGVWRLTGCCATSADPGPRSSH